MAKDNGDLEFDLALGVGLGLLIFWKGFRAFREFRVVEDTPETSVRSVAMGLVRVHGKADGEQQIVAPVSRSSCYFYRVDIQKWDNTKNKEGWRHYRTDRQGIRFYLEDQTGALVVDPTGAECELIKTAEREIGRASIGTGSSVPRGADGKPLARASAGDNELRAYIARGSQRAAVSAIQSVLGSRVAGGALGGAALNNMFDVMLDAAPIAEIADDRFRLTEYCIQPGHWYDVTGTCSENPGAANDRDRNLISKGANEPTFLISWRTPKEVEKKLRNRAAMMIFGGAAVAIACLGFLLAHLGML